MIQKGKRYRVIKDSEGFFESGEIIVALEDDTMPWCIRDSDYDEKIEYSFPPDDTVCAILYECEIEKIEGESYAYEASEYNPTHDELLKYRSIGTLEECRAAVEKQKERKPNDIKTSAIGLMYGYCPMCNEQINTMTSENYCTNCGQKLDWGE